MTEILCLGDCKCFDTINTDRKGREGRGKIGKQKDKKGKYYF